MFRHSPVGGLGFGLIAGIVSYANVVEAATGPGVVGIRGPEDSQYLVLTSGKKGCVHVQCSCPVYMYMGCICDS